MYTKNKLLKVLSIVYTAILVGSLLQMILGFTDLLSLLLHYWGDWFTITHARSTPESVFSVLSGIPLTVVAVHYMEEISNARFYSSYFECDLDGKVEFKDLSDVTGKSIKSIRREFATVMRRYMKRFSLVSDNGRDYIALQSKKYLCICRHCGAQIEKKEYFVGKCPYCGGSDLRARILSGDRFYSIVNDTSKNKDTAAYFQAKNLERRKRMGILVAAIAASLILVLTMYALDTLGNIISYDDYISAYYHGVLFEGKPMKHYSEIKRETLITDVVYGVGFILSLTVFTVLGTYTAIYALLTMRISKYLPACKKPFLQLEDIRDNTGLEKPFQVIFSLIRSGYLKNCTFERHGDEVKLALAKKIQKDICPNCGAPINGAVDDHYVCPYCSQPIMDVVVKK